MALKRRIEKAYTIDEMFNIINDDFISNGASGDEIFHFVISPVTGETKHQWVVMDSREATDDPDEDAINFLPCYYGKTIEEAVAVCFAARAIHETRSDQKIVPEQVPVMPPAPPVPAVKSRRGSLAGLSHVESVLKGYTIDG